MIFQDNLDTLSNTQEGGLKSTPYMPTRKLQNPLSAPQHPLAAEVRQLTAHVKPVGLVGKRAGAADIPLQASSCIAKEKSGIVSVSFARSTDKNFASVRVWLTGYLKNSQPQLLASGVQSPVTFPCTISSPVETVSVIVQTVGPTGATSDLTTAARCTVKLS